MRLKRKYTVLTHNGKYYVQNKRENAYFTKLGFNTWIEAEVPAIQKQGLEISDQLDEIQALLEKLGAIRSNDPYAWRA